MPAFIDLTNRRFNRLVVITKSQKPGYWLCRCDCGATKEIRGSHMSAGLIQSCGCFRNQESAARSHVLHKANTKTGLSRSPTYQSWSNMKSRCYNPNTKHFAEYGGRGIKVCDEWINSFEAFLQDMGECPKGYTIDRWPDNNGNYEKSNCRWATRKEQQNNTRQNRHITYYGMTKTAAEWSDLLNIPHQTIYQRMDLGWNEKQILSKNKHYDLSGLKLGGEANGAKQRAKTHCKNGHPFDEANTAWYKGTRSCRTCHAARQRARNA